MHLIEMTNTDVVLRPSPYLTKQQKSGDVPREGCLSFSKLGNCQENALIVDFYYYKVRGRCGGDAKNYGLEMGKTIYFPLLLKMKNEVKLEAYFVPNCLLPLNIERYMFWCNADDTYCYGNEDRRRRRELNQAESSCFSRFRQVLRDICIIQPAREARGPEGPAR